MSSAMHLLRAGLLASCLTGCVASSVQQEPAAVIPSQASYTKRIQNDGIGGFILPDGTRAPNDGAGGLTLPNGAHLAPDQLGNLRLPTGAVCIPDRVGGYLCP